MRPTALLLALAAGIVCLPANAFERLEIAAGDRLLVSVTEVTRTHEYLLRLPRDGQLKIKAKKLKKSNVEPARGLLDEQYRGIDLTPFGRTGARSGPLPYSGTYRLILQGANDTLGDLQADTQLKAARKARLKVRADDEETPTELVFGALPDHQLSFKLKWKGDAPVSVTRIVGPGDTELTSETAPKVKKRSAKGKGYTTTRFGDHRVELDVPEGTQRWDLTVKIKGRGTAGVTRDLRITGEPQPDGVEMAAQGVRLENGGPVVVCPVVSIVGESGGPNALMVITAARQDGSGVPVPLEPSGCRTTVPPDEDPPSEYLITCDETHSGTIGALVRDGEGRIVSFTIDDIVTPDGAGSTVVSGITYSAIGAPTGWTEVRTFDGTGDVHRIVVSGAELFASQAYTYRVEHTTPGGVTRTYDYLPFD